jgi:hypothetical protein
MFDVLHLPSLSGCNFSLFAVGNTRMGIEDFTINIIIDRKS